MSIAPDAHVRIKFKLNPIRTCEHARQRYMVLVASKGRRRPLEAWARNRQDPELASSVVRACSARVLAFDVGDGDGGI
eukprot:6192334-Pyramimonas_sp.AAC.1